MLLFDPVVCLLFIARSGNYAFNLFEKCLIGDIVLKPNKNDSKVKIDIIK
jgi:hypothetical protein